MHQATPRRSKRQLSRNLGRSGWSWSPLSLLLALIVVALVGGGATLFLAWDNLPPRLHAMTRAAESALFPRGPHAESVPTVVVAAAPEDTLAAIALPTAAPAIEAPAAEPPAEVEAPPAEEGAPPVEAPPAEAPVEAAPPAPEPAPPLYAPALAAVQLAGIRHEYQGWNNCGPATLAMQLSYFGRAETQAATAPALKPDPDDKNVSPDEMARYAQGLGFEAMVVTGLDIETLKLLISNEFPVIVESWYIPDPNDEMGHYLLAKGYEGDTLTFYDSYDGPDVTESVAEFDPLWQVFNRTAIVVWPPERAELARSILGERTDETRMHMLAVERARAEIEGNAQDKFAWFNLGSSLTALGEYEYAAQAFDTARSMSLPWRMLWYQFGLYEAYFHAGRHQEVIDIATSTLQGANNLEESYYWRGRAHAALGNVEAARADLQRAVRLNGTFEPAQAALAELP